MQQVQQLQQCFCCILFIDKRMIVVNYTLQTILTQSNKTNDDMEEIKKGNRI